MISYKFKLISILVLILSTGFYNSASSKSPQKGYEEEFVYFRVAFHAPDPWQRQSHEVPALSGQSVLPEPSVYKTLIVADLGQGKIFRYDNVGNIIWSYCSGACFDLQLLPSGNILFVDGHIVKEIDRTGKVLCQYDNVGETYSCQRLPNGYTLVGDCSKSRLIILDRAMRQVKTIPLQVKNIGHHGIRWVRKGPRGTYFVTQEADHFVGEYGEDGKLLRCIQFHNDVYSVVPMNNGNVIMGGLGGIRIVDQKDKVVWSLMPEDVPEVDLQFVLGIELLPTG